MKYNDYKNDIKNTHYSIEYIEKLEGKTPLELLINTSRSEMVTSISVEIIAKGHDRSLSIKLCQNQNHNASSIF